MVLLCMASPQRFACIQTFIIYGRGKVLVNIFSGRKLAESENLQIFFFPGRRVPKMSSPRSWCWQTDPCMRAGEYRQLPGQGMPMPPTQGIDAAEKDPQIKYIAS